MAPSRGTKGEPTPPPDFPVTNPPQGLDQYAVMQSLLEMGKDLAAVSTKLDRLISDVDKLSDTTNEVAKKVGRAQIALVIAGILLLGFGALLWWMFGEPITHLRNQLIPQQPVLTSPAVLPPAQ